VACFAAELVGVRVLVRFETAECGEGQKYERPRGKENERRAVPGIIEIDLRHVKPARLAETHSAMNTEDTPNDENDTDDEKCGEDDESDDAHVRLGLLGERLQHNEKNN
jgi:hypothetical protein